MGYTELAYVIWYCVEISRMVSPNEAKQNCNFRHDGAIADFLRHLGASLEEGQILDLSQSDFDTEVFNRIKEDVIELFNQEYLK